MFGQHENHFVDVLLAENPVNNELGLVKNDIIFKSGAALPVSVVRYSSESDVAGSGEVKLEAVLGEDADVVPQDGLGRRCQLELLRYDHVQSDENVERLEPLEIVLLVRRVLIHWKFWFILFITFLRKSKLRHASYQ